MMRLLRDDGGATAVYVALGIGAIVGAAGMALDLGRAMTLETELQQAADASALAGAAELDGQDGARDRARAAAMGAFGTNVQTFATDEGGAGVTVSEIAFLRALDPDAAAANDSEARFVQVRVTPRDTAPLLMPVVSGDRDPLRIGATATAGLTRVACKIPPLMVCNPFEAVGAASETPFDSFTGQQILIKSHTGPQGGQWAPGTFGLLDTPEGAQGAQTLARWLAKGTSPGCFGWSLSVRPGQADAVRTALNTRFDMYENPFFGGANSRSNPDYRPAVNVTKGRVPGANACSTELPATSQDAMALPRDTCIANNTCRFGMGDWDRVGYWMVNNGMAPPAGTETRYQTYRWEIDNARIPDPDPTTGTTKERGGTAGQRCYSGVTPPADDPDRRVLHFAVVNCSLHDIRGNDEGIPPVAFVKAFLTEPASSSSNIYLETIEVAKPDSISSVMHDVIQLYR